MRNTNTSETGTKQVAQDGTQRSSLLRSRWLLAALVPVLGCMGCSESEQGRVAVRTFTTLVADQTSKILHLNPATSKELTKTFADAGERAGYTYGLEVEKIKDQYKDYNAYLQERLNASKDRISKAREANENLAAEIMELEARKKQALAANDAVAQKALEADKKTAMSKTDEQLKSIESEISQTNEAAQSAQHSEYAKAKETLMADITRLEAEKSKLEKTRASLLAL